MVYHASGNAPDVQAGRHKRFMAMKFFALLRQLFNHLPAEKGLAAFVADGAKSGQHIA
jgi:hypothetical protein